MFLFLAKVVGRMRSPIRPSVDQTFVTVASKLNELTIQSNAAVKTTGEEAMCTAIGTATIQPGSIRGRCVSYCDTASSSLKHTNQLADFQSKGDKYSASKDYIAFAILAVIQVTGFVLDDRNAISGCDGN
jgi:hypothetical protein